MRSVSSLRLELEAQLIDRLDRLCLHRDMERRARRSPNSCHQPLDAGGKRALVGGREVGPPAVPLLIQGNQVGAGPGQPAQIVLLHARTEVEADG